MTQILIHVLGVPDILGAKRAHNTNYFPIWKCSKYPAPDDCRPPTTPHPPYTFSRSDIHIFVAGFQVCAEQAAADSAVKVGATRCTVIPTNAAFLDASSLPRIISRASALTPTLAAGRLVCAIYSEPEFGGPL